jgi:hypothetical protein
MYGSHEGSSSRRIAVTGRSDQHVYFASQQAMNASACAVLRGEQPALAERRPAPAADEPERDAVPVPG